MTNTLTIAGNLVRDPEVKFTKNGKSVTTITIAHSQRTRDKATQEWVDGEPLFLRASLWDKVGENAADSLTKGDRVIAIGRLKQSTYTDNDGNERTSVEFVVDEIGASLKFAGNSNSPKPTRAANSDPFGAPPF